MQYSNKKRRSADAPSVGQRVRVPGDYAWHVLEATYRCLTTHLLADDCVQVERVIRSRSWAALDSLAAQWSLQSMASEMLPVQEPGCETEPTDESTDRKSVV